VLVYGRGLCLDKKEESFNIAVKAFSDGFYDASLSLFKRLVNDYPHSPLTYEAKLYIAKCYYYKENYTLALEVLGEIEKNYSKSNELDEVYYWLSLIYIKGKDFNISITYAERIIKNYPDSQFKWWANYLIASSNFELGNIEKAERLFKEIIAKSNDPEVRDNTYLYLLTFYIQQKKYLEAIMLGEQYLRNYPRGALASKVYFYLGESYYAQNDWNKSLDSYIRALKIASDDSLKDLIYQGLGFSYLAKGNKIEAKTSVDKINNKELRLFSQGVYYFKIQDYFQALETFNIFINDYPKSNMVIDAYLNKADILYEMGRINDAIYQYRYILDNFKDQKYIEAVNKAHYGLAWSYLKNGKFKQAIDEFKNTLEYANNPVVKVSSQIQIADAYQETARYDEALDIYSNILKTYPNTIYADYIQFQIGMCLLKKKDLEKAFLALKNLKNNFPTSKLIPQAQYYLAVGYFAKEDYIEARNLLDDFINKFPQSELIPRASYLYGKAFFNEGKFEEALRIFKKIIGKFADRDTEELVYIDIGNCYLNLSLFDDARKTWEDFFKRYPNSQYLGSVNLYLGGLYEKEKDYTRAEKYYRKIIDEYKDPAWSKEAFFSLAHLYWSKGDLDKAEDCFSQIAKQDTPFALRAKLYLAKIIAQKGKLDESLRIYDELIRSETPVAKIALTEKAFLFKEMKDYPQAIKALREAIRAGIDTPEVRFSLGFCLEKIEQNKDAIDEYLKVIYGFSDKDIQGFFESDRDCMVNAYFHLAHIYEKDKNIAAAKKIYEKIISLGIEESKIAKIRLNELEKR